MKKTISLSIFIILNLLVFRLFPVSNNFQGYVVLVSFLVIAPIIYSKFINKSKISDFGITIGKYKEGLIWSLISLVIGFILFYMILNYFSFFDNYSVPSKVYDNFWSFLYYELVIILFFNSIYEFFFRGFVLMRFSEYFGYYAIILQYLLFMVMIMSNSSFNWNFMPLIIFSPLAGLIVFKSKSIFYSLIAQTIYIFIIDLVVIRSLL